MRACLTWAVVSVGVKMCVRGCSCGHSSKVLLFLWRKRVCLTWAAVVSVDVGVGVGVGVGVSVIQESYCPSGGRERASPGQLW